MASFTISKRWAMVPLHTLSSRLSRGKYFGTAGLFDIVKPDQNDRYFTDGIFECKLKGNYWFFLFKLHCSLLLMLHTCIQVRITSTHKLSSTVSKYVITPLYGAGLCEWRNQSFEKKKPRRNVADLLYSIRTYPICLGMSVMAGWDIMLSRLQYELYI